jgi:hypothetical protein
MLHYSILYFFFFLSFLFWCWNRTQGLTHARQALYHRSTSQPSISIFVIFLFIIGFRNCVMIRLRTLLYYFYLHFFEFLRYMSSFNTFIILVTDIPNFLSANPITFIISRPNYKAIFSCCLACLQLIFWFNARHCECYTIEHNVTGTTNTCHALGRQRQEDCLSP